jgi:hypothetical protein
MKVKTFDRKFDAAEKIIDQLDLTKARRMGTHPKRVNVDFPSDPFPAGLPHPLGRTRTFPLDQLVWPDPEGRYPWDELAPDSFKEWQPVLGPSPLADSRRR